MNNVNFKSSSSWNINCLRWLFTGCLRQTKTLRYIGEDNVKYVRFIGLLCFPSFPFVCLACSLFTFLLVSDSAYLRGIYKRKHNCIRPYLDSKTASTIAASIIHSKLDYCNSLSPPANLTTYTILSPFSLQVELAFLHSHSYSFRTAFMDLNLYLIKGALALFVLASGYVC